MKKRFYSFGVCLILVLVLGLPYAALAQDLVGSMTGAVLDSSGGAVAMSHSDPVKPQWEGRDE